MRTVAQLGDGSSNLATCASTFSIASRALAAADVHVLAYRRRFRPSGRRRYVVYATR
jgi:hypothetical protein